MMFVEGMAGRAISSSLPLLLFLLLLSSSLASTSSLSSWTVQGPAPKESLHVITLWTRQNNIADQCDQLLYRIADPDSPSYGDHYSMERLRALTYDEEALDQINAFLNSHSHPTANRHISKNGDFIRLKGNVEQFEEMFGVSFLAMVRGEEKEERVIRSKEYRVPSQLRGYVSYIAGMSELPSTPKRKPTPKMAFTKPKEELGKYPGKVIPELLVEYYGLPSESPRAAYTTMATYEEPGASFNPDDLVLFQKAHNLTLKNVSLITGRNNASSCFGKKEFDNCGEGTLDVQFMMGVATGANMTYWIARGSFYQFLEEVAEAEDPPKVFDMSYGVDETDTTSPAAQRLSIEVCKLGLRGITVVSSSGDEGAACNGRKCNDLLGIEVPASSPYVTAVGASMGPETGKPEVVCSSDRGSVITSGGGFSKFFQRPSFQETVVSSYLKNGPSIPPNNTFDSNGRAIPDVTALGDSYEIYLGLKPFELSGTSASAPVFAAMVAVINSQRASIGKKPLGFLNPALYKLPQEAFHDVTVGNNRCCPSRKDCCPYGWSACPGWDAASGLGSPNFPIFSKYLVALP